MRHQTTTTSAQIVKNQQVTLLELLDRLLDKGVMVKGEILLSVADIDLVYLNLGLLLSSVKTVEEAARRGGSGAAELFSWQTPTSDETRDELPPALEREDGLPAPLASEHDPGNGANAGVIARTLPAAIDDGLNQLFAPKTNIDPEHVEKGLAKLVLTLIDLLRKLMEKQAIRRVEAGQLHTRDIERMGNTFLLLDERMEQLKETFGLQDEDLNIDLGPLGELL